MLTLPENWIRAIGKDGCVPVFLVELDLSTSATTIIHKFVSTPNSQLSYDPSVSSVSPLGSKLDPINRTSTMGEASVLFVDDGVLRDILSSTRFKGKKVAISIGEESLEEADFAPYFTGTINDVKPSGGLIELILVNTFGFLKQKIIKNQSFTMLHPLEVMEKIFEKAELSSDLYDATTFDPDEYATTISHWNVSRGGYNLIGASSAIQEENAFALINELAHICQGTVVPSEDGKLSFSLYDSSAASLDTWTADDISKFSQDTSVSEYYNKIVIRFQFIKEGETYARTITHTNTASSEACAWPGDDDKELVFDFDTKWLNSMSMLWESLDAADTECTISGLLGNCFCGMRQQGTESEPNPNRKVYLLVATESQGSALPTKQEVIECDGITLDQDVWVSPADMNIWQSDSFFVGSAIALKSSYDISAIGGRKYFDPGTTSTGLDFTNLSRTYVYDLTIPVYLSRQIIERLSEGLCVISLTTNLSKYAFQIGDLITIEEPEFLTFGSNGATTDKWEVIEKNVDINAGKIKWGLSRVSSTTGYTEAWTPTTTSDLVSSFIFTTADLMKSWNQSGLILGDFTPDYTPSLFAGLDLTVNQMFTSSPYTPINYPSNGTTIEMPASSTITVGRDMYTGMTIFGTNQSNLGSSSYAIETVTTSGAAITDVTALAPLTGFQGNVINGFPGFQGSNLEFPYWNTGTGGLFLNTTDNIPLMGQTSPDSYDTRVIAQGPTAYYKMDEPASAFPTVLDSSGNGNNATTTANDPEAERDGLIRAAGSSVGFSFAFNQIGPGAGDDQAFFINGLDANTSVGCSFSTWLYSDGGSSAERTIFCIASDGAGNDVFRITHDPTDNELRVYLNTISTSFTDASLGKDLSDGSLHHLVVTWNAVSKELDIWIDGALRGYGTVDTTLATIGTRMGWGIYVDSAGNFDANNAWNGVMDVAGYWDDKVLSTAEIMDQYQSGGLAFGGAGVDYQPLITSPTNAALSGITADDISETADRKWSSGSSSVTSLSVPSGDIIVGDGSGDGATVTMSNDATMSNTGAITIADGAIGGAISASNYDTEQLARAWIYRNAHYVVSGSGPVKVLFNDAVYDEGTNFNWADSTWTCPQDGLYQMSILVYVSGFVGSLYLYLYKDLSLMSLGNCSDNMGSSQALVELNNSVELEAGDEMTVWINSSDSLYNVIGTTVYSRWQVARIK